MAKAAKSRKNGNFKSSWDDASAEVLNLGKRVSLQIIAKKL